MALSLGRDFNLNIFLNSSHVSSFTCRLYKQREGEREGERGSKRERVGGGRGRDMEREGVRDKEKKEEDVAVENRGVEITPW